MVEIHAVYSYASAVLPDHADKDGEEGCLSCAIGTKEPHDGAALDRNGHVFEDRFFVVGFVEMFNFDQRLTIPPGPTLTFVISNKKSLPASGRTVPDISPRRIEEMSLFVKMKIPKV